MKIILRGPFAVLFFTAIVLSITLNAQEEAEENLQVFWKWSRWNDPGAFLAHHLLKQADRLYEERKLQIEALHTKEDWQKRQTEVRRKLDQFLGHLPEKTPLNAKITEVLEKDGYRMEKLVYESMPGFYVAGCLFIPDNLHEKAPAILNVIGHNQEAFRAELYQTLYLNLVKKGFIVLAIDPIGQGESVQFYDPEIGFSRVGYSVVEHNYAGNLCFLSGTSLAGYFTWDGIRGIDYLVGREEVDPERIGVTGFSGGGTVTLLIAAMDDRVKVSVPCSWSLYSQGQLETKGIQDAESFFYHGLKHGISCEDLVEVRAPKPTLMTFTSRDEYLSIQGARNTYAEARKAYSAFGQENNIELVEDDFKHWLTPKIRNAIYAFFMEHLQVEGDFAEEEVNILSASELRITPTGQVSTWLKAENVQSVNAEYTQQHLKNLEDSRLNNPDHLQEVRIHAADLSGFIEPVTTDSDPFLNGRYQREGYTIAKYGIRGEGDYRIPLLLFVPDEDQESYPAVIYLHPSGKESEALPGGEIEKLVRSGYIVAAADVSGIGEIRNTVTREGSDDYMAVLTGRSIPGLQAGDILRVKNFLQHYDSISVTDVGAVGIREMCIPLLHATAFEPSLRKLVLISPLVSYRSIVMNKNYRIGLIYNDDGYWHPWEIDFSWGVAGAMTAYDLPDLMACIAPGKMVMVDPQNQLSEPASQQLIEMDLDFPIKVYDRADAGGNFWITSFETTIEELVSWCFQTE